MATDTREAAFRRSIMRVLKEHKIHSCATESGDTAPGYPDIDYCSQITGAGKLELKVLKAYPKRSNTKIRIHPFKRAQATFMKKRVIAGGVVGLLLKVDKDVFLLDAEQTLNNYCRATEAVSISLLTLKTHCIPIRISGNKNWSDKLVDGLYYLHLQKEYIADSVAKILNSSKERADLI